MDENSEEDEQERKKRLKREANRRSAQLSRQRKKAFVEDLKAKNAEYLHARSVLACHPDAVFATDGSGVIAYANPAAAKRAHADATRLTGTSFPNLLDQDSRRRFVAAHRRWRHGSATCKACRHRRTCVDNPPPCARSSRRRPLSTRRTALGTSMQMAFFDIAAGERSMQTSRACRRKARYRAHRPIWTV